MSASSKKVRWLWTKRILPEDEESWVSRIDTKDLPGLVFVSLIQYKTVRLEVYGDSRRHLESYSARFGGVIKPVRSDQTQSSRAGKAIRVRDQLVVVQSVEAKERLAGADNRSVITIPAGSAFGTGDHATTVTCLRLLVDLSRASLPLHWDLLDAGTGSGIVAIAAKALGARRVDAFDFDPAAVRTALDNARRNNFADIRICRTDIQQWRTPRQWDVVVANMYSEVLKHAAPAIVRAVRSGGWLILSGMLREQTPACCAEFVRRGVQHARTVALGKWATLLMCKG